MSVYEEGHIPYFKVKRGGMRISHLFYADDSLIFTNATREGMANLHSLLLNFSKASGQCININKSAFAVDSSCDQPTIESIIATTGYSKVDLPIQYLGVPLFKGKLQPGHLFKLTDVILCRLEGWKAKVLSFGGRVTLIRSVLCYIPVHSLSLLAPSKAFTKKLEKMFSTFLWSNRGTTKFPWIAWDTACRLLEEGGLGIKKLQHIASSLHGKLAWKMMVGKSLWG